MTASLEYRAQEPSPLVLSSLAGFVSYEATFGPQERAWQRLVLSLDGFARWNDVPVEPQKDLLDEAEAGRLEARKELELSRGGDRYAHASPADWSPGVGPVRRRELPHDPVEAGRLVADGLTLVHGRVKRWKAGVPATGLSHRSCDRRRYGRAS